jgi:galactokinase
MTVPARRSPGSASLVRDAIALAPTPGMDQSASLRCQGSHALRDCRDGSIAQVPLDLSAHGFCLLVMDTCAGYRLVEGQYAQRRASCEEAARELGIPSLREVAFTNCHQTLDRLSDGRVRARARHVVTKVERVRRVVALLRAGRARMWAHCSTSRMPPCEVTSRSPASTLTSRSRQQTLMAHWVPG